MRIVGPAMLVAFAGKIINLHIPELYSIVRGKVGKSVEFGLNWGITRLRGGYLLATLARRPEAYHQKVKQGPAGRNGENLRAALAAALIRALTKSC